MVLLSVVTSIYGWWYKYKLRRKGMKWKAKQEFYLVLYCYWLSICVAVAMTVMNHSEFKTDMDVERFPSGKFATNSLVMELAVIAYNILRMIGQESTGLDDTPRRKKAKWCRLRTMITNIIMFVCHLTEHARRYILGMGRSNTWRYTFRRLYYSFSQYWYRETPILFPLGTCKIAGAILSVPKTLREWFLRNQNDCFLLKTATVFCLPHSCTGGAEKIALFNGFRYDK